MKFNSFTLKLIAIFSSILLYFCSFGIIPDNMIWLKYLFGILGSASFTLFGFLLNEAVRKTSSINKLVIRSLVCAVLCAFPYHAIMKLVYGKAADVTAYFSPALSALICILAITTLDKLKDKKLQFALMFMVCLLAYLFNFYGAPFVFITVFIIHWYRNDFGKMAYLITSLNFAFCLVGLVFKFFINYESGSELDLMIYQIGYILPLPLIKNYSETEGFKLKYFTYVFYPILLTLFLMFLLGRVDFAYLIK